MPKVYKIEKESGCNYLIVRPEEIECLNDYLKCSDTNDLDVGDVFTIEVIEMSEEELETIGEFDGDWF